MSRYRLVIEYNGRSFNGWQRQDNGPSVQQALEMAANGYCQTETVVQGCGRTDSGVHGLAQVAHVDLPRDDPPEKVIKALNAHIRQGPHAGMLAIVACDRVHDDFHARFDCLGRRYIYRILTRPAPPVMLDGQVWWLPPGGWGALDVAAMNAAAQCLVGHHDFTSFRASACQSKNPEKSLDGLTVIRKGEEVWLRAWARSFLHHQVRNMVGTLVLVGQGRWLVDDVRAALAAKNRAAAGPTAPAEGLYFAGAVYADKEILSPLWQEDPVEEQGLFI